MSNVNLPTDLQGGFKYTPVSYSFGNTSQVINGGFSFDLPLATVAAFTNTALDFNANNTNANRGFLSGVISGGQSNLSGITTQAFDLQKTALQQVQSMFGQVMDTQRYAIKKGLGGGGGCFITTAVTKAKGLPDDCADLQALRAFRDEYMLATPEGEALVRLYYAVAPAIVDAIDNRADAAQVYARLDSVIQVALNYIGCGYPEHGQATYVALVHMAAEIAGVEIPAQVAAAEKGACTCNGGKRAPRFHAKTCPVRG